MTSDTSAYRYVDSAIGGVANRNHVLPRERFAWFSHHRDVYTTAFVYSEELLAWQQRHTNAAGRPTVSGYRGPCTADGMFFDFDSETDLERALADTRTLVRYLGDAFDIPLEALVISFSGNKGFHVVIPASLFADGGFEPSENLPARMGAFAEELARTLNLATMDLSIYQHLRLFRVENTRHGKTDLYAIPLTTDELLTLSVAEIRALAQHPRTVDRLPDDEWLLRPDLAAAWQATAGTGVRRAAQAPKDDGAKVPNGQRHAWIMGELARIRNRGYNRACLARIAEALNEEELEEPLLADELAGIVAHVAQFAADAPGQRCTTAEGSPGNGCTGCEERDRTIDIQQETVRVAIEERDLAQQHAENILEALANPALKPVTPTFLAATIRVFADISTNRTAENGVRVFAADLAERTGLSRSTVSLHVNAPAFTRFYARRLTREPIIDPQTGAIALDPRGKPRYRSILELWPRFMTQQAMFAAAATYAVEREASGEKRAPLRERCQHTKLIARIVCATCGDLRFTREVTTEDYAASAAAPAATLADLQRDPSMPAVAFSFDFHEKHANVCLSCGHVFDMTTWACTGCGRTACPECQRFTDGPDAPKHAAWDGCSASRLQSHNAISDPEGHTPPASPRETENAIADGGPAALDAAAGLELRKPIPEPHQLRGAELTAFLEWRESAQQFAAAGGGR